MIQIKSRPVPVSSASYRAALKQLGEAREALRQAQEWFDAAQAEDEAEAALSDGDRAARAVAAKASHEARLAEWAREGRVCVHCEKSTAYPYNYCDFQCMIAHWRTKGGPVITPNGLPIVCLKMHNGALQEHEHADHSTYLFPVQVENPGASEDLEYPQYPESHALIYTDGSVALTLHECTYALFSLWGDGEVINPPSWRKGDRLAAVSLVKVREVATSRGLGHGYTDTVGPESCQTSDALATDRVAR